MGSSTFCLIWHELTPPLSSRPALSLFSLLHLQSQQTSNGPASTSCHRMNHLLLSFLIFRSPAGHASAYPSARACLSFPSMLVPYPQPALPFQLKFSTDLICLSSCASSSLIVGEPSTSCLHPLLTPLWPSTGHSEEEQQGPRPLDEVGEMRLRSS